jgi:glutamine amidotransferase-like uncharacterized protein
VVTDFARRFYRIITLPAICLMIGACQGETNSAPIENITQQVVPYSIPVEDRESPSLPLPEDLSTRKWAVDALIYQGTATATGGAEAIVSILKNAGYTYRVVTSSELNALSSEELKEFGTIIWPGGYAGQMSRSLTKDTRDRLSAAVRVDGVSFVGFCAGAFIAVSPDTDWGLSVIQSETLPYYHLEDEGVAYAMVELAGWDGPPLSRSVLWWGGPKLTGFTPDEVLAVYSDTQEPAITRNTLPSGAKVLLSGPHPEAPQSWRNQLNLSDRDGLDQDMALSLIQQALEP